MAASMENRPLKPYKTFLRAAEDEFIVNKSRFIGHGKPVETEEEALAFLNEMRQKYKDASHNCYAYIIGKNMGVMRYNDDGEPGGTAGMPIIEVLKAREVTNCVVVVTRYFGGILLGAGGLTRAYAQGAAVAVNACGVGVMHPTSRLMMEVPYPMVDRMDYFLKDQPVQVEDREFAQAVTYTMCIKNTDEADFSRRVVDLSQGKVEILHLEEFFMPWQE